MDQINDSGLFSVAIVGILSICSSHFLLDLCGPFLPLFDGHNHGLAPLSATGYLRRADISIENRKLRLIFHFIINDPISIRNSTPFYYELL